MGYWKQQQNISSVFTKAEVKRIAGEVYSVVSFIPEKDRDLIIIGYLVSHGYPAGLKDMIVNTLRSWSK